MVVQGGGELCQTFDPPFSAPGLTAVATAGAGAVTFASGSLFLGLSIPFLLTYSMLTTMADSDCLSDMGRQLSAARNRLRIATGTW